MTYFYRQIQPGRHVLSTESEFSDNFFAFDAKGGENYYVHHYIKLGLFVGGANLKLVSQEEGKKGVLACKLAYSFDNVPYDPKSNEIVETASINSVANVSDSTSGEGISAIDYYGEAEEEIYTKTYDKNLWTRALVEAEGDEQKRKASYIELRANQLYSENVSSISKSNLNEQPYLDSAVSGAVLSGIYLSDIHGDPPWMFKDRKPRFTFEQSGKDIVGTDVSKNRNKIIGIRNGDTIKFKYWGAHRLVLGEWQINPDGTSLEGTWEADNEHGSWNLTRIK